MILPSAQRLPLLAFASIMLLMLGGLALITLAALPPESLLVYWVVLGAVSLFVMLSVKGDLLTLVFIWFVTLIALHEEFWRQPVPFFFSLTIPRVGIVVLIALFLAMLALGRIRLRTAWPISGFIAAIAVYFTLSAATSGFETRSIVSVHYRLVGGYLFPFVIFGIILHIFQREQDFKRLALFFAGLSVYLVFTGWCERLGMDRLIWPAFITDPQVGIHFGRVRGPFVMSAAMGLALIYCFFNNLVLIRNVASGRWLLYGVNALMLPVLFWTKTRSVWLSFAVCGLVWVVYSRRRMSRTVLVCLLLAAVLLVSVINMDNFLSDDRDKGGLTDTEPILLRIGLAQMSWEIIKDNPLFGVGFGHFRDFGPSYARDPSSPYFAFGTTAMEHNNLLSIASETGLVGVGLYLLLLGAILRHSIRLYRRIPVNGTGYINRDLLVLYWITFAAYLVDGTFRETSDNPFANSLFFGLSAVPIALDLLLGPRPFRAKVQFGGHAVEAHHHRRPAQGA